jgi:acyl-CoA hydrolase
MTMEDTTSIKKRKLVLNRETVMPLQSDQLDSVHGGQDAQQSDNLLNRAAQSAATSAVVSGVVTAVAGESATACAVASGAASAAAATVDHVSNKLGLPCWAATSLGSAAIHFTRKW